MVLKKYGGLGLGLGLETQSLGLGLGFDKKSLIYITGSSIAALFHILHCKNNKPTAAG